MMKNICAFILKIQGHTGDKKNNNHSYHWDYNQFYLFYHIHIYFLIIFFTVNMH